jgi:protein-L-isoaspartate(D-aspartate) O-methyltransferase
MPQVSQVERLMDVYVQLREEMVREQLMDRGIRDAAVLDAFRKTPRELFIPGASPEEAYADHPVPIGHGQTISQPYIVALTLESLRLKPGDRVLEIGTGSGYQTALLAAICREVYTVERVPDFLAPVKERLETLGRTGVRYVTGDGTLGWPEHAPYDAIAVSASAPRLPPPLLAQMADGGRMVIPVGDAFGQELVLVERTGDNYRRRDLCGCVFVRLIGAEGWKADE